MGSANFTEEHADYKCFAVPEKEAIEVPCFGKEHCVVHPYPRLGIADFGTIQALDTKVKTTTESTQPIRCRKRSGTQSINGSFTQCSVRNRLIRHPFP